MSQHAASQAAAALRQGRAALAARIPAGAAGRRFCRELSALMDTYFRARLAEIRPPDALPVSASRFMVVAVGGYGRSELCLHSDIDILVLYDKRIPAEALDLAQSLFYPLWDLGLDLGHGFRSVKDCLALARKDFEVLASLLDARLIEGDPALFARFQSDLLAKVAAKKATAFSDWLRTQNTERLARHGDSSALLEPDLKEGLGGLRDVHQVLWLGRVHYGQGTLEELLRAGRLSEAQVHFLTDALRLLLRVRNLLHHVSGRRGDRLHLDQQRPVAEALGYRDEDGTMAVERFLGRLHRDMAGIKALHGAFTASLPGAACSPASAPGGRGEPGLRLGCDRVDFDLPRGYPSDPMVLARIFEAAARTGLPLSWEARGFVSGHLYLVRERLRASAEAAESLLRVLTSGRAGEVLGQMLETGYLGALLPEFGRVQDLVQFDTYHIYPVGQHTIRAVALLEGPMEGGVRGFADLRDELLHPRRLMLGALFHDIGKGLGGGHSAKGAEIARQVMERWGLDEETVADVEVLVREHLTLYETATRRDLNDEAVVAACAGVVGGVDRLRMLMLLSWADAAATGPQVWKQWTASLLWELYRKILHILRGGRLASADAVRAMERTREEVRAGAGDAVPRAEVEAMLALMPQRYLLQMSAPAVVRHMGLVRRLRGMVAEAERVRPGGRGGMGVVAVQTEPHPELGCWEVAIAGMDNPGLFATLAGVLALHGINIVSAQCFLWRDGTAVDVFNVSDPPEFLNPDDLWTRVAASVRNAMSGRLDLAYRIGEKRRAPSAGKSLEIEPEIAVHNQASDFHTVIEVTAADRIGILYDIATALHGLGLSLQIAKIATYGDRVADVFYVRESSGGKAENPDRVREIEKSLLGCLSGI